MMYLPRTIYYLFLIALSALAVPAGVALGDAILDQSQEDYNGGSAFYDQVSLAQTFTPALTGQLDHIKLFVDDHFGDPSYPATVSIVQTVAGVPSGALLGEVNLAGFSIGWNFIDFLPASVNLNAGTEYGIVLANDDPNHVASPTDSLAIQWFDDHYPAGVLWEWSSGSGWAQAIFEAASPPGQADAAFRTYLHSEPAGGLFDPIGQFWYGWIGANVDTALPSTHYGVLNYAPSSLAREYDTQGSHQSWQMTINDSYFDPDGWFVVEGTSQGNPATVVLASNNNVHFFLQAGPDADNSIGIAPAIRKAIGLDPADLVGQYSFFGHWLGFSSPGAAGGYGTLDVLGDGSGQVNWLNPDGTPASDSFTWTYNPVEGTAEIIDDDDGDVHTIAIGADGQLMMQFDIDFATDDALGYNFFVRKGASLTAADIAGRYLVQIFETDLDGLPYTEWGTVDFFADGTFAGNGTNSEGGAETYAGTFVIDPDGTVHVTDPEGTVDGIISPDGELIFLPSIEYDPEGESWLGGIYLIKPAPEPGTLLLLALGIAPLVLGRGRKI